MKRILFTSVFLWAVTGCEKDELPKPVSGNPSANTVQVSMGSDYGNQLFFDLATNTIVSQNMRDIWDLGFAGEGNEIILNSSKFMSLSKTDFTDLANVTSSTPVDWHYDNHAGKADSMAFYQWELDKVYIINRGQGLAGEQLGKLKMQIIGVDETSYTIRWGATLNAATFETATFQRSDLHNFTFFSFTSSGTVSVEPEKDQWDLCFTSYTFNFHDGTPYLVTGVLTNRNLVRAYESEIAFGDIDYGYASSLDYPADIDIIGYDWKVYDFDLATYTIDFSNAYVVKSVQERYYKIRFLDFYDSMGAKGAPTFEVQELVP